jgi:predicted nucleotide-binding protein
MKPKLFIGSSTEGKNVAEAIHAVLQREAECTVWTEGVFQLSESSL